MKNKQSIGILGGMSPSASHYMYDSLIQLSTQRFGAKNNSEFPEILLYSVPVPDFISNNKDKNIARDMLMQRVKDMNKLNVSSMSIACNTAHLLLGDLQKVSSVPFTSMIDEVAKAVYKDGFKKVGILGSPTTIKSNLYQNKLQEFNIELLLPSKTHVRDLDRVIRNVINGESTLTDRSIIASISDELVNKGAEGIILGCTELPIIFPLQYKIQVYNSVEILCMALLRRYYESNTIDTI